MYTVSRSFRFEAAHWLPLVPENHKCRRMHGHSYKVDVLIGADELDDGGFVTDFANIDTAMKPLIDKFDHQVLNDFLKNPTAELICDHISQYIIGVTDLIDMLRLGARTLTVRVHETERAYAECVIRFHGV